jgi:subtilase family serine protease
MGPWADYQYPLFGQSSRATPDMSFDADPASGVWIYSQYGAGGWTVVGGTSVSSPALASIVNRAGNKLGSVFISPITGGGWFNNEEDNLLYSQLPTGKAYKANFYDVKTGSNGSSAVANWDYCTGVGSPRGVLGK